MPLSPGQILQGRYTIQALLGQGGFGAVYQAHDGRLGQTVALKENLGGDARQFHQEAMLLAGLRHPSLPHVGDQTVEPNGAQYLVMDFIAGEDLDARLQRAGALSEAEALRWLDQILDAVAYLHSRGIIHRDIKPANIKITPGGQAVLVDFGIAKIIQPGMRTMTGAKAVSSGYAAPEQYRGGTDARSDVYSLGATLYTLLIAGAPPDAQARERGIATLTPPRQLNASISAQTEQVIMRALAVQMQSRFQSAVEMKQAMAEHAPTPAPQTSVVPKMPVAGATGTISGRTILGIIGGLLTVFLLGFGFLIFVNLPESTPGSIAVTGTVEPSPITVPAVVPPTNAQLPTSAATSALVSSTRTPTNVPTKTSTGTPLSTGLPCTSTTQRITNPSSPFNGGEMLPGCSKSFVVRVNAGQVLALGMGYAAPNSVISGMTVRDPSGAVMAGEGAAGTQYYLATTTGDYTITFQGKGQLVFGIRVEAAPK